MKFLCVRSSVKYVRTMLVMRTPYTQQSKACVWCCYHGGHATTLSCHMNVCVHGHSRPYFDVTCVAFHRVSLRQSALRAPQPNFKRAQAAPHGLKAAHPKTLGGLKKPPLRLIPILASPKLAGTKSSRLVCANALDR